MSQPMLGEVLDEEEIRTRLEIKSTEELCCIRTSLSEALQELSHDYQICERAYKDPQNEYDKTVGYAELRICKDLHDLVSKYVKVMTDILFTRGIHCLD